MHNYLTVSHCSELVMLFKPFFNFFIVVYFAIVLKHNPAVTATKRLCAASASNYCKSRMSKRAFSAHILKLHCRNGVGPDYPIVGNQAHPIGATIHHTVEH
jgi:hypothetical protein